MRPLLIIVLILAAPCWAERRTVSLNGDWEVAESVEGVAPPSTFAHRAPVPGLTHSATPPFADVDRFDSAERIDIAIRNKELPESARIKKVGTPRQARNYSIAVLRIGKAQFGTAVWLNGTRLGEYWGCFTASEWDVKAALKTENELLVRIGAHPAAMPEWALAGTDQEKRFWTPGIYDDVTLILTEGPRIVHVQAAPQLASSSVLVETMIENPGAAGNFTVTQQVGSAKVSTKIALGKGEKKAVRQTLRVPGAKLWTPETPHLYTLRTTTRGDSLQTRFGMREFRFDTATKRAYLNGKPYFLRGSNITLHRFFEDEQGGTLPWDKQWVRKLLVDHSKRMHWNSYRFCIGPVPDFWFDIADEAGLLIQNEFFIWRWRESWDVKEVEREMRAWMRDAWNHPSVGWWDADNETREPKLADLIRALRPLDLSNRAWDNGYNDPVGPDDPVEDHPYLFSRLGRGFEPRQLMEMTGAKSTNSPHPTGHATVINEYGWLWMNRDGTPTELTGHVYEKLVGKDATPEQRFAEYAYWLAGLTEFWRAHRTFAGVLHFTTLTSSYPTAFTGDHWRDVRKLEPEPHFAEWVSEAFRPLGVYVHYWEPSAKPGAALTIPVMLVNDEDKPQEGSIVLTIEGTPLRAEVPFELAPLGQHTYRLTIRAPETPGRYELRATAGGTRSRRRLTVD